MSKVNNEHTYLSDVEISKLHRNLKRVYELINESNLETTLKLYNQAINLLTADNVRLLVEVAEYRNKVEYLEFKLLANRKGKRL